jgi:Leucine-rich repeat (LRR) protein
MKGGAMSVKTVFPKNCDSKIDSIIADINNKKGLDRGSLDLSGEKLTDIPPEILKLENLSDLDLSDNLFSDFPSNLLKLKELRCLNLSGNKLTVIPQEISTLNNLSDLDLSDNLFCLFPLHVLYLQKLTVLDLSRNNISKIEISAAELDGIKQLNNPIPIQTLRLNENNLSKLHDKLFPTLKKIEELDLHKNNFNEFPHEINKLKTLLKLDLSENKLTYLPEELSYISSLKELDLSGNSLRSLNNSGIGELRSLEGLYISGNKLSDITDSLPISLIRLDLRGNSLNTFPNQLLKLEKIQSLYLGGNNLAIHPDYEISDISNLKELKRLDVSNNDISNIPAWFFTLENLIYLDLSKNKISNLPSDISHLTKLKYLYIEANKLDLIPSKISRLSKLQKLNLRGNRLIELPSDCFDRNKSKLSELETLDLRDNKLDKIQYDFNYLKNLSYLYLDGNILSNQDKFPTYLCNNKKDYISSENPNRLIFIDISPDYLIPYRKILRKIQENARLFNESKETSKDTFKEGLCNIIMEWEINNDGSGGLDNFKKLIHYLEYAKSDMRKNKDISRKIEKLKSEGCIDKKYELLNSLFVSIGIKSPSLRRKILKEIVEKIIQPIVSRVNKLVGDDPDTKDSVRFFLKILAAMGLSMTLTLVIAMVLDVIYPPSTLKIIKLIIFFPFILLILPLLLADT